MGAAGGPCGFLRARAAKLACHGIVLALLGDGVTRGRDTEISPTAGVSRRRAARIQVAAAVASAHAADLFVGADERGESRSGARAVGAQPPWAAGITGIAEAARVWLGWRGLDGDADLPLTPGAGGRAVRIRGRSGNPVGSQGVATETVEGSAVRRKNSGLGQARGRQATVRDRVAGEGRLAVARSRHTGAQHVAAVPAHVAGTRGLADLPASERG
jgi:hypothetical protein